MCNSWTPWFDIGERVWWVQFVSHLHKPTNPTIGVLIIYGSCPLSTSCGPLIPCSKRLSHLHIHLQNAGHLFLCFTITWWSAPCTGLWCDTNICQAFALPYTLAVTNVYPSHTLQTWLCHLNNGTNLISSWEWLAHFGQLECLLEWQSVIPWEKPSMTKQGSLYILPAVYLLHTPSCLLESLWLDMWTWVNLDRRTV